MSYDQAPLADRCEGRWPDILRALGASPKWLNRKNQPCPLCQQGRDCFRWTDHENRGLYFCSKCGPGDGPEFVKRWKGLEFAEAAKLIEEVLPGARIARHAVRDDADKLADVHDLIRACRPIAGDDPAGLWLRNRVPGLSWKPQRLAYTPDGRLAPGNVLPAMVAVVQDRYGKVCQAHRTFLTPDGEKALGTKSRLVMPGPMPDGCAIRLGPIREHIGVAEGIETALACSVMYRLPVWACINAQNLGKFVPPEGVKHVTVFADHDESLTGHAYAYTLAMTLRNRKLRADVEIPDQPGTDFNDVLLARPSAIAA